MDRWHTVLESLQRALKCGQHRVSDAFPILWPGKQAEVHFPSNRAAEDLRQIWWLPQSWETLVS